MTDSTTSMRIFRPGVGVAVPHGWFVRASVELVEPELDAHVLVSLDDGIENATVDEYADEYGTLLERRTPAYEEVRREKVVLSDRRPAVVRRFRWQGEGGVAVEQAQVYVLEGRRGLAATLSTPRPLDELEPKLLELVGGIRIDGASGSGLVRLADDARSRTYEALERGELAAPRSTSRTQAKRDQGGWREARTAWEESAQGVRAP